MGKRDRNGRKAAELQSTQTSRHENTGQFLHKQGAGDGPGYFALWQWNETTIQTALNGNDFVLIPETHAQPPLAEGTRLVKMIEGYEAQYWHQSDLMSSRWWPYQPSERDWAIFLRGLSLDEQDHDTSDLQEAADPVILPWRSDLNIFNIPLAASQSLVSPRRAGMAAALIVALFIAFPLGQSLRLGAQLSQLERTIEADPRDLEALTQLRRDTLQNLTQLNDIASLAAPGDIPKTILDLNAALGESEARLVGFGYSEDRIEVRLSDGPANQLPDLIARLEDQPGWANVNARTDTNNVIIVEATRIDPLDTSGS